MSREMKDSGVEWIGNIPNSWNILPINNGFTERREKVSDIEWEPLSVTKSGIVRQLEHAAKSDNHNDRKKVCVGDFAINSRSDRKESCGLSSLEGSVSLINTVLIPNVTVYSPDYIKYLLKNYGFAEEFYRWGTGIVADLWSTNFERMKNIKLPLPPLSEQQKIADFLDEKVKEIDNAIEKTKETIELYKKYKKAIITEAVTKGLDPNAEMKDSGIEWIGDIPKKWNLCFLKYCVESISDLDHKMPESLDEGIPYVMTKDLQNSTKGINWNKCKKISIVDFNKLKEKSCPHKGDVIFARYATIGSACYVNTDNDFLVSYSCVTIKPNNMTNGKYLFYILISNFFNYQTKLMSNTNVQGNIGIDTLRNIKLALAPLNEQDQIIKFLDEKCNEFDNLIKQKEKIIDDLDYYKKSIIYEYATGKKEVK